MTPLSSKRARPEEGTTANNAASATTVENDAKFYDEVKEVIHELTIKTVNDELAGPFGAQVRQVVQNLVNAEVQLVNAEVQQKNDMISGLQAQIEKQARQLRTLEDTMEFNDKNVQAQLTHIGAVVTENQNVNRQTLHDNNLNIMTRFDNEETKSDNRFAKMMHEFTISHRELSHQIANIHVSLPSELFEPKPSRYHRLC